MFFSQILALAGRVVLAAAAVVSVDGPVVAEYPRDTASYASFMQLIRVLPLDHSLMVIHLTRAPSESGITASVLHPDGTIVEWRATDWLRAAARLTPGDDRLWTQPDQVGQIYSATLLPTTGQLAVSIGWRDLAGRSENGIALVRAVGGSYVAERILVLPMTVRDLAAGPGNTIVASVFSAEAFRLTQQSPTLAVIDTDGNVTAEALPFALPVREADAVRKTDEARVIGLSGNRVAFVTPGLGRAYFVRIESENGPVESSASAARHPTSMRVTIESVVNLGLPAASLQPTAGQTSVRAIYVDEQQRVGVLYSVGTRSRRTFALVLNTAASASEAAVLTPADVRAAYWADGRLHTVVIDADRVVVTGVNREALAQ